MSESLQIVEPIFPEHTVDITDFGAVPGGKALNTEAINAAIAACAGQGGGRVVIPRGLWLTGPIVLQSNVNLHLERGALVLFTPEYDQYPVRKVNLRGIEQVMVTPPLFGEGLENIAITGNGVFDGSGHHWRPVKRMKMTEGQWRRLVESGGVVDADGRIWWPNAAALNGAAAYRQLAEANAPLEDYETVRVFLRPRLMNLINCRNILINGPVFQNSPMWNLHPLLCENVIIRNITVRNPWYAQNGDGLDLESCRSVIVENSIFDVGDDAICLKSGKDETGRKIGVPTENVLVRDCTVYHGHGGFVVGSEMSGGVRNVTVTRCEFIGTDVGLRFKTTRGRGGVVEKIDIDQINMINIDGPAIIFDMYYDAAPKGEEAVLVTEGTPEFRDVTIRNVVCRGAGTGIFLRGLPEMPLRRLKFNNIQITANKGVFISACEDPVFHDVLVENEQGQVLFKS